MTGRADARVTVLVAAYQPRWLDETVASIRAQTYGSYEVLVIDDEGSDETQARVDAIGDARFRYVRTPGRLGAGGTHELGLQMVTTDLAAILNHDDLWGPDFLARTVAALDEHPEASIAFCDHWVIDESGVIDQAASDWSGITFGRAALTPGICRPFRRQALLEGAIPLAQAAVFRPGPVVGASLTRFGSTYDRYLTYRLVRGGSAVFYIPDRLSSWRTSSSNLSFQIAQSAKLKSKRSEYWRAAARKVPTPIADRMAVPIFAVKTWVRGNAKRAGNAPTEKRPTRIAAGG